MGKRCLGIGLQGLDRSPEVVGTREREDRDGCGRVPNTTARPCPAWPGVRCPALARSPPAQPPPLRTLQPAPTPPPPPPGHPSRTPKAVHSLSPTAAPLP